MTKAWQKPLTHIKARRAARFILNLPDRNRGSRPNNYENKLDSIPHWTPHLRPQRHRAGPTTAPAVSIATPAAAPASAGLVNDYLRQQNSAFTNWDFGGSVRGRFEVKDGYGIPGVPGSLDFRAHGADVDNEYFLEKIRFRGGYTDKWWSALVEGESSLAQSDQRWAYANNPPVPGTVAKKGDGPEADSIELHQAIVGGRQSQGVSARAQARAHGNVLRRRTPHRRVRLEQHWPHVRRG